MSTRYLSILSVQTPFYFNTDDNGRVMFSTNFEVVCASPSDKIEEEIAALLVSAAACTALGTDLFVGGEANIPNASGPYTSIITTGGSAPGEAHDGAKYENQSVQLVTRANKYRTARTRALAVWRALDGVRNTTVAA